MYRFKSVAVVCALLMACVAEVYAEGIETLGPVVGTVASGSELVTAGVGLVASGSGTMKLYVPEKAVVKQVFLYWQGRGTKDATAVLNDRIAVTGTLVGQSDPFKNTQAFAYRVDITSLGLVRPGNNSVKISGLKFGFRTDGASLVAVIDDGSGAVSMDIRDGADFAYHGIKGLGRDTVKQVFTFPAATSVREGRITVLAGDGEVNRPDELELYVGTQKTLIRDALRASEGDQWDVVPLSFLIPPGVTSVSLQLFSRITNGMATNPESLTWVMAAFELGCAGKIGDQVWLDANRNGVMEVSELGLAGVRMALQDNAGQVLQEMVTDTKGHYLFQGVCAGSYKVVVDASSVPLGLLPTYCAGQTMVSGAVACAPKAVSLSSSVSEVLTVDFGYAQPPVVCRGRIGDQVWLDGNRNAVMDAGEAGIAGVRMALQDGTGRVVSQVSTDTQGRYLFEGLCPGSYKVVLDASSVPADVLPTYCAGQTVSEGLVACGPQSVVLAGASSEVLTVDFGYAKPEVKCTGRVGDQVWLDGNRNGVMELGETGIAGVRMVLQDGTGHVVSQVSTNAQGRYLFEGLCEGSYKVAVDASTVPSELLPTYCAGQSVSEGLLACQPQSAVLVGRSSEVLTLDFGYAQPPVVCTGVIGDEVWLDGNRNGVMELGETGIAGVRMVLQDGTGRVVSQVSTNAQGRYLFEGLCEGAYQVSVDASSVPAGLLPTYCAGSSVSSGATACAVETVVLSTSASSVLTVDFGYAQPLPPPPVLGCFTMDEVSVTRYWNKWGWSAVGFNVSGTYALSEIDTMALPASEMAARLNINGLVLEAPRGGWLDLGNRWARYDHTSADGAVAWHWLVDLDTGFFSISYWGNGPHLMNGTSALHAVIDVMGQPGVSDSATTYSLVNEGQEHWAYERPVAERCPGTCE